MKKPINFKSTGAYWKWLAYGHKHKLFEKTPGHQRIKIKGKEHKVSHKK